jgi:hypothetical protein
MTWRPIPLTVECPACHSTEVFYSCDPHCCFNHVCADCRASFFLTTRLIEGAPPIDRPATPTAPRDPTVPTAPCDRCGGLQVWSLSSENEAEAATHRGLCADCGALLLVEITAEAP